MIVGKRGVCIAVERYNTIHKVPNALVVGMENVGTVFVDIDSFYLLTINIST